MIDQCLDFLKGELNLFLKQKLSITQDKVSITSVIKPDGKLDSDFVAESVGLMLVNTEEEFGLQPVSNYSERDSSYFKSNPDLCLNLKVLAVLNFTHHSEALKFMSALLGFFQSKQVFKKEDYMQFIPPGLEQLRIKFISQTLEQQNHLWGAVGAKYMPSLLFKVGLLKIQENRIVEQISRIEEIKRTINSR